MKFFKVLIILGLLAGCAGPKKYTWPEKKNHYSFFKTILNEVEKNGVKRVVIMVCSDSFSLCTVLEKFWKRELLPMPFFMVDADKVPPDEIQSLVLSGISLELPLCFMMDGNKQGLIGNGLTECTLALESVIRKMNSE